MQAALARSNWDLIICDYSLPQFDAPSALRVLRDGGMISLSLRKACKYLREQSGKQFDPQVVEVFLREIVGK
jgi:CheY-like chemotaxis protein